jgi:translation initiation factor 1
MSPRIVYSTDPEPVKQCPRCGSAPCVCDVVDLAPKQQTAYVKRDRKGRAGKTVTIVYGLQHSATAQRELLATLKMTCGSGGTIKEGELEIQGDQRDKVAEKLRQLGYKVKLVGG